MSKSKPFAMRDTVLVTSRASTYYNQAGQIVGFERKYRSGSGWYDAANVQMADGRKNWFAYSSLEKVDPIKGIVPGATAENAKFALLIQTPSGLAVASTYVDEESLEIAGRALRMQITDRNQRVFAAEFKGEFKLREPQVDFAPVGN